MADSCPEGSLSSPESPSVWGQVFHFLMVTELTFCTYLEVLWWLWDLKKPFWYFTPPWILVLELEIVMLGSEINLEWRVSDWEAWCWRRKKCKSRNIGRGTKMDVRCKGEESTMMGHAQWSAGPSPTYYRRDTGKKKAKEASWSRCKRRKAQGQMLTWKGLNEAEKSGQLSKDNLQIEISCRLVNQGVAADIVV